MFFFSVLPTKKDCTQTKNPKIKTLNHGTKKLGVMGQNTHPTTKCRRFFRSIESSRRFCQSFGGPWHSYDPCGVFWSCRSMQCDGGGGFLDSTGGWETGVFFLVGGWGFAVHFCRKKLRIHICAFSASFREKKSWLYFVGGINVVYIYMSMKLQTKFKQSTMKIIPAF